ncbi:glycoside hydrolase family 31 protein [Microbacterium sp. SS28]|uniref:glycoside hydrolase family 31 protein n=1 Tax=Microbacterium sp. SS28 TaxID=2919948 RepID=UPI001FA9BB3D|nr:glycoside hydrolase family 31 protein [Microbacterium sp. SS28]
MYSADISPHLRVAASPLAHPASVVQGDRWRLTVLTEGLVRVEWSQDGVFEDRATMFALRRDLPVPEFRVIDGPEAIEIVTARLHLRYDRGPFSPSGLTVRPLGIGRGLEEWKFGEAFDLGGTARTLDGADGRVPLQSGIVSKKGVGVVDDSSSFVFTDDGWVSPRAGSDIDLYVFAYAHDYAEALRAFYDLSGSTPVLPRWALGNWWSRYHRYTTDSYRELLDRFEAEGVRFSVAVLDMDWHRVDSVPPEHGSGWTGYSWEPEYFPDPEAFLDELHSRGLKVTLNLHPADGVRSFEDAYRGMAEALGRDPEAGERIPFEITDPAFLAAYFEVLHHPLEAQGVDFWWMDWQHGPHSRVPGVDPLWMLNHFHYLDTGRDGGRPLLLSRYAGPGSHRYPLGFSGDTVISWDSLAFQPEFTATASNIGYAWWSHDIGGHMFGTRDDELTVRWVQLGVYSPILRLHSSDNPFLAKEPWAFPAESRAALGDALRERVRLVPYLHSMNHRAAAPGIPLVLPLYYEWPESPEAYTAPTQFLFGSELLVAPITSPRDGVTLLGSVRAWLPPGTWTDVHSGQVLQGGRTIDLHRDLDSIPVLLKAGGIIPLASEDETDAAAHPAAFDLVIAAGADGSFTLVEDDGELEGSSVRTVVSWSQASGELRIGPAEGPDGIVPPMRTWTVTFLGLDGDEVPGAEASPRGATVTVSGDIRLELVVATSPGPTPRTRGRDERLFAVLNAAQYPYDDKERAWKVLTSGRPDVDVFAELHSLALPPALVGAIAEQLTSL